MKFGVAPINLQDLTDPDLLIPFVQRAEALGDESRRWLVRYWQRLQ